MQQAWKYIIVTQDGYYTGSGFSQLKKHIQASGYFDSYEEAERYSRSKLKLIDDDFDICQVKERHYFNH
jgi:hypothetical protein